MKILFLVNHLAFFSSHRLKLFKKIQKKYQTYLITGLSVDKETERSAKKKLRLNKINYKICKFSSTSLNIYNETRGLIEVFKLIKNNR